MIGIVLALVFLAMSIAGVWFLLASRPEPPRTPVPVRVGRIHQAKLRCRVCDEPFEEDDIVFIRDGEPPWHARHKDRP